MRMFIGFPLTEDIKKEICLFQDKLTTGRKTAPGLLHVTLLFLGELDHNQIKLAKQILNTIKLHSFSIRGMNITKLRDMVIIELAKSKELMDCALLLQNLFLENNFQVEKRPFYPHVTVSRNNHEAVSEPFPFTQTVDRICLFSSQYQNNQLVYPITYQIPLKK
ncbi:MAG: RNA 2',3'-cyclic phosphodiesterase [Bacilli bacterium]|nr:RNA 2',3'-cyclic phosphodiesterase [Bacilli bacterium]MDY0064138.1 RNA 2',3'-cyclic phosphodiesterase [Bacilli bacterium]